jgi:hypothetical protein
MESTTIHPLYLWVIKGMAEEEGNDGEAEEEELDSGAQAEEEQIPRNLHGYWVKCHIRDAHVQALESEGTVAPQEESH